MASGLLIGFNFVDFCVISAGHLGVVNWVWLKLYLSFRDTVSQNIRNVNILIF